MHVSEKKTSKKTFSCIVGGTPDPGLGNTSLVYLKGKGLVARRDTAMSRK